MSLWLFSFACSRLEFGWEEVRVLLFRSQKMNLIRLFAAAAVCSLVVGSVGWTQDGVNKDVIFIGGNKGPTSKTGQYFVRFQTTDRRQYQVGPFSTQGAAAAQARE